MASDLLTPDIQRALRAIARRELSSSALLFVAGHRPLGWAGAQVLYLFGPWAELLGLSAWTQWASLLEHPEGLKAIEEHLLRAMPPAGAEKTAM